MKKITKEELNGKVSEPKPEMELAEIATSIPTDGLSAKDTAAMIADTEKKIELIAGFIKRQLKEGKDYGQIAFHAKNCPNYGRSGKLETTCGAYCKMSRPFLQKPGSEKFAILFNHRAKFIWEHKDFGQGEFAAKCLLINRKNQEVMGEGYGSAYRSEKQKWTNNEAMKMSCKRCLTGDTPIYFKTEFGVLRSNIHKMFLSYLSAKKVKRHIYLPTPQGEWVKVLAMEKTIARPIVKITLQDGSYIRATKDHRFPTKNRGLQLAQELTEGDNLKRSNLPSADGNADTDFGWLIGLFLADGSFCKDRQTIKITTHSETNDLERIKKVVEKIGSSVSVTKKQGKCISISIQGEAIVGLIRQFVNGETSHDKHLSHYAWRQSKGFLWELLEGYLAGDGHKVKSKRRKEFWALGFTGKNLELAHDLRTLGSILDKRVKITNRTLELNGKMFGVKSGWIKENHKSYNQKSLEEITNNEEEKSEVAYDIQIDSKDEIFLLANGIETHNSQIDAALRTYGLSEHFTQDLDDMEARETPPMPQNRPVARDYSRPRPTPNFDRKTTRMTIIDPNAPITQPQMNKIFFQLDKLGKDQAWFEKWTAEYGVEKIENLTKGMASKFIDLMQKKLNAQTEPELETIDIDDPRDNPKQDTEIIETEVAVSDEWEDF